MPETLIILIVEQTAMVTCSQCESDRNPNDANFCGQCGGRFEENEKIAAAVTESLQELKAARKNRSGHGYGPGPPYIEDSNSRRIFGRLRRACGLSAIPFLVDRLTGTDFLIRWKAIRLLAYFHYADAETLRKYWMQEQDPLARILILECIEKSSDAGVWDLLVSISADDDDREIRAKAVGRLSDFTGGTFRTQAIAALLDATYDNDSVIRSSTIRQLINLRVVEVAEAARDRFASGGFSHSDFVATAKGLAEIDSSDCMQAIFARLPKDPSSVFPQFVTEVVPICVRRFGADRVLDAATHIPDETSRKKVEDAVHSAAAP